MNSLPGSIQTSRTNQQRPLISVIVPAYNAEDFILEALRSIAAQDYEPLEILLVDDGSTDDTANLVRREMPAVRIIRQDNTGVAEARNTGLRNACGEFICLLDADDGWCPGKLHAQVQYLQQHPQTGAVYHAWQVWRPDAEGNFVSMPAPVVADSTAIDPALSGWIYPQLLMDCIVHTSTIMMRREFVEQLGFFRAELINGEDYDYWLRLSRLTRIDKLVGVYSFYRGSPGSLTNSVKPVNYEYNVVSAAAAKWGLAAPDGRALAAVDFQRRLGKLAFDFAYRHYRWGSARIARRAALQAWRHDPRRYNALLFWLASFFRRETGPTVQS